VWRSYKDVIQRVNPAVTTLLKAGLTTIGEPYVALANADFLPVVQRLE